MKKAILLCAALSLLTLASAQEAPFRHISVNAGGAFTNPMGNDPTVGYAILSATWTEPVFNGVHVFVGPEVTLSLPHRTEYAHTEFGLMAGAGIYNKRIAFDPYVVFGVLAKDSHAHLYASYGLRISAPLGEHFGIYFDLRQQKEYRCVTNHTAVCGYERVTTGLGIQLRF